MLRRRGTGGRGRDAGVSAVEFGLVLPVFLIVLLGIIDYGWVFYVKLNITNAAREGARVGVTQDTGGAAKSEAELAARNYLVAANMDATVGTAAINSSDPEASTPSGTVQVDITYNFSPLVGFVPTPNQLYASAAMRWELASP
jgi:Flp pilus assembly protein TadG